MPTKTSRDFAEYPLKSHGFYMARHIITASERAGLDRQEPFTPIRKGETDLAKLALMSLQKEAVDMIAIYKRQGFVVPYALDESQDTWNYNHGKSTRG